MPDTQDRKDWMGLLAKTPPAALAALWETDTPAFDWLRRPETGTVMVRGRTGGTGAAFNLGEVTVTRCALRLATGETGHAYVMGRDKDHAERAALIDALMQTDAADSLRETVLDPLADARAEARQTRAGKAAATKVEFFTMQRGED